MGQGIFLTLLTIDWRQTQVIATDDRFYETNPVLGKYPTIERVNTIILSTAILHTLASWGIWKWNKNIWRWGIGISIGIEGFAVWYNWRIGVRF